MKKISVEGGRRRYPQITIMLDYNGAEKGCSGTKEGVVMVITAFADGADAYLVGGKEFSMFRNFYVEIDRPSCCPSIDGQTAEIS